MIRAAFLRRMAFAALASALFEVRVPEVESEPEVIYTIAPEDVFMVDIDGTLVRTSGRAIVRRWL